MGHGYTICKHPEAKKMAKEKNIPIEINPISNQVLGLVKDLRNHPAVTLIQEGFPIVISSDAPGLWDAKGLSYDYYSVFMAMAGKNMNLKLLKKLVSNSLQFSTLKGEELEKCQAVFQTLWDKFFIMFMHSLHSTAQSVSEYMVDRIRILEHEDYSYLGSNLTLTTEENLANNFLMTYKVKQKKFLRGSTCMNKIVFWVIEIVMF